MLRVCLALCKGRDEDAVQMVSSGTEPIKMRGRQLLCERRDPHYIAHHGERVSMGFYRV